MYNANQVNCDAEDVGENQRLESKGINVISVPFNQGKVKMQSDLRILFHDRRIKVPADNVDLVKELRRYNWDTKKGEDLVDALMLAVLQGDETNYWYRIA